MAMAITYGYYHGYGYYAYGYYMPNYFKFWSHIPGQHCLQKDWY